MFRFVVLIAFVTSGCTSEPEPQKILDAAERGDVVTLNALIEDAKSVDMRDSCLFTPLMKAALNGHGEAVRQLLLAGADVNAADKGGYTALMFAASNNHGAIVEALVAAGADVDHVETTQGWTALIWAANRGHAGMVKLLLARGADAAIKDHKGMTVWDWARTNDHGAVAESLKPDGTP